MSILSAHALRDLIFKEQRLVVTPLLEPKRQIADGSASIDLRLGTRFIVSRKGYLPSIDTSKSDFEKNTANLQDTYYVPIGTQFVLHPGAFVLASTLEYVRLPEDLVGNVLTRSSWGRHGLIIATAIAVQPGFAGLLTLELRNLAEVPLELTPGRTVLQIFFHQVEGNPKGAFDQSAYVGTTNPSVGSFAKEQTEIETVRKFADIDKFPLVG